MTELPVVLTDELTRQFGAFVAVDRVSFSVHRGEIFGYLGANGAGKSTTIRMLCGLLRPTAGRGLVNGIDVASDPDGVKRSIGYMSQRFSLYLDLTVWENIQFFGGAYGLTQRQLRERGELALEMSGLSGRGSTMTRVLSGGWRQRLALATALIHQPGLVFLDEPTSGVDPEARRNFWRLIRQLSQAGTTVFVTTHYMDEAEYCDRIGMMVDGRLVALDTPANLKRTLVPGDVFTVSSVNQHEIRAAVEQLAGIIRVSAFGASLHVLTEPGRWTAASVRAELARQGIAGAAVEAAQPTLEDVFIETVAGASRRT